MTIRYDTTRSDLVWMQVHVTLRHRFLWLVWVGLAAHLVYSHFVDPATKQTGMLFWSVYSVVVGVMMWVVFFGLTTAVSIGLVLLRKNIGVLGEHSVTLTDAGIVEKTDHNESMFRWSAYHRTVRRGPILLLYVTDAQVLPISRRRPLIEGDLVAFEASLAEKLAAARARPVEL